MIDRFNESILSCGDLVSDNLFVCKWEQIFIRRYSVAGDVFVCGGSVDGSINSTSTAVPSEELIRTDLKIG